MGDNVVGSVDHAAEASEHDEEAKEGYYEVEGEEAVKGEGI